MRVRPGLLLACAALAGCNGGGGAVASDAAAGVDAPPADAAVQDAAAPAHDAADARAEAAALEGGCEPVDGACDLVLQDCPAGSQCAVRSTDAGTRATACGPTYPVQHVALGYPCCPPASPQDDPCLPGLTCVGDPCVGDAAAPGTGGGGGRCTPYCCSGDDTPCGASPEGYPGRCDLGVVDDAGTRLYDVCDYAPTCEPLGVVPCPAGYGCIVRDGSGDARCVQLFNAGQPPAAEGQPCAHDNACADGLMCLTHTVADGGTVQTCLLLCSTGQGAPPFDAGALDGGAGAGGCDPGKQCVAAPQIFPAWLGVCL